MKERPILMQTESVKAILDGRKSQTRRVIKPQPIKKRNLWEYGITKSKGVSIPLCLGVDEEQLAECMLRRCPHGQVGSKLWVRETWAVAPTLNDTKPSDILKKYSLIPITYKATYPNESHYMWRPSIFMPRWASRITLEITELRPERLQEITDEDAKAEGANPFLLDKLKGGTKYKMLKTYHHEFYPLVDHADEGEEVVFECPNMGFARLHHAQWKDGQDPVFRIPAKEAFEYIGALEPDYKNGFQILWDSLNAKRGYSWTINPWVWVIEFRRLP